MLRAYFNYPNSRVSVHGDSSCGHIQPMNKAEQRLVRLDATTIGGELQRFADNEHRFASYQARNDMWVVADFGDEDFELAVIRHIHRHLARRYTPFHSAQIEEHCRAREN